MKREIALAVAAAVLGQSAAAQPPHVYQYTRLTSQEFQRLHRKDYVGAIELANQAIAANPKDPLALAGRGLAYQELGDYPHAIADHDGVLAITPDDSGALGNACWVRALANIELDRALAFCGMAMANDAASLHLLSNYDSRAFVYFRRGEYDLAVADYNSALKVKAGVASSLYGRGLAKLRLGRDADGRADLAEAVKHDPKIADVYAKRGVAP